GHDLREGGEVEPRAAGGPAGIARWGRTGGSRPDAAAVVHHDDERLRLARGDQVVHDQVRAPLAPPSGLVLAGAVLEAQHRVAFFGVLVVIGRRVDEAAARTIGALGEVQVLA